MQGPVFGAHRYYHQGGVIRLYTGRKAGYVYPMTSLRNHIFAVCILALVTAMVSPACAFISGKSSLMEICTSSGAIKTVDAAGNEASDSSSSTHKQSGAFGDCAFCLHSAHYKHAGFAEPLAVQAARLETRQLVTLKSFILSARLMPSDLGAQGPPAPAFILL